MVSVHHGDGNQMSEGRILECISDIATLSLVQSNSEIKRVPNQHAACFSAKYSPHDFGKTPVREATKSPLGFFSYTLLQYGLGTFEPLTSLSGFIGRAR